MNLTDIMLSEIRQLQKYKYLYEACRVVKITETESRVVFARGWEEGGMKGSCLISTVSVLQDERSFGGGLHNRVNILNTPECPLRKG